jgi:RHS repeat-associated protein
MSGNLADSSHVFDAEGRLYQVGGSVCYIYDGEGDRVAESNCNVVNGGPGNVKGITSEYLYDIEHRLVDQIVVSGPASLGYSRANIYAGGEYLGEDAPDSLVKTPSATASMLRITDQAGSLRSRWDLAGNVVTECTSFPYGEGYSCAGATPPTLYTGKERDAESGNDYFGARYYASSMGRFLSPDYQSADDDDVPEAVPNGSLTNPQTLNLYSYTQNNPLSRRDYDGHASWGDCADGSGSQCFNGDYNGERNCQGSSGCLFWNGQSSQWQGTDPTATPEPSLSDVPGMAFTGLSRLMMGDRYGAQQMGYAYARTFASVVGAGGLIPLPSGTPLGKPAIVPNGWVEKPSKKGGGTIYEDPSNPHNRVRVMPGDPNSPNPAQREPYMKVQVSGRFLDAGGNEVSGDTPEAHIPVDTPMESPFIP